MKNVLKIGDNSANTKFSVEVENGILSVSSRFEFVPLDGKKGGFGMSSFVEQMSSLMKDCLQKQSVSVLEDIEQFLSAMNYQKSETEHQTSRLLFEEYLDFCKEHYLKPIGRVEFLRQLENLGFEVKRCMTNNATFIYCKKGKAAL